MVKKFKIEVTPVKVFAHCEKPECNVNDIEYALEFTHKRDEFQGLKIKSSFMHFCPNCQKVIALEREYPYITFEEETIKL